MRTTRCGFTLLEVIVVLAIVSLTLGVSGVALVSLRAPHESARVRALHQARETAIHTGRPVSVDRTTVRGMAPTLFLPDGRALGPDVDPLTGAPRDAAR